MLVLVAALAVPVAARGQQTEQELVRHLDSVVPLLDQARKDALAARKALQLELEAKQPAESLDVGPMHVLVPMGEAAPALDVVGTVWERDYASFVDRSPSLEVDRLYFQWAVDVRAYQPTDLRVRKVAVARWRSRSYVEGQVQHAISESLKTDLEGHRFGEWPYGFVRPPSDPQSIYRQVAVAPSKAAQACIAGDAPQCLVMLGLGVQGYFIDELYSPEERQLLVRRQYTRFSAFGQEVADCRKGSFEACDAALHGYVDRWHNQSWGIPVLSDVNASLLWYAMQVGGEGAWGRLLDHADEEPLAALAAAAGMNADALAAGWRNWLMEQHPESHAGLGSLTLGALFWTLLLITFAARSTRWRLA